MRRPKSLLAWQFSDPDSEFTNCSPGVSGSSVGVGDPFLIATPCAPGVAGKHRRYHHRLGLR
jgi:hypothetical protein